MNFHPALQAPLVLDPAGALVELEGRLGVPILSVVIDDIDFLRETTRVSVRYTLEESAWQWTSTPLDPARAEGMQS